MINICYSLGEISDVAYTKEISISIRSICENTKEPLNFFILLDGTINQSVVDCTLNDFLNVYSNIVGINYIDCVLPDTVHMSEYTLHRFKKASMFRLCLPSVLPKIKKIIYLDADVIFDADIVKLWNMDVDYLGAVYKKLKCPNKNLKCHCEVENHFCSGVMVMNLEKIRDKIEDLFDAIVVGYDVERSKPFPDIFLKAAEKVGSKPEECLVLEDSEAGIQAAYAAGIPVICVPDLNP